MSEWVWESRGDQASDGAPPPGSKGFSAALQVRPAMADAVPDDSTGSLTESLGALATPARIHLLRTIRTPKTVTEIKLRLPAEGEGLDRLLARQTVKQHLDRLVELGFVVTREAERAHGKAVEYVINHQALYSLSEEVRSLARLRPAELPEGVTRKSANLAQQARPAGSCLILVKGLDEGLVYSLTTSAGTPTEWIIGRRRGIGVSLDFDPFVSSDNSRITWDGKRHLIEDLPLSRNGTLVNFRELRKGVLQPLENGDIVGVGRSALVYRT